MLVIDKKISYQAMTFNGNIYVQWDGDKHRTGLLPNPILLSSNLIALLKDGIYFAVINILRGLIMYSDIGEQLDYQSNLTAPIYFL